MSEERISAQDLRDFVEGRTGPATDLYAHCLRKLVQLVDEDLRRIFLNDLVRHTRGESTISMELTFKAFAEIHRIIAQDAASLPPPEQTSFIQPV